MNGHKGQLRKENKKDRCDLPEWETGKLQENDIIPSRDELLSSLYRTV